MRLRNAIAFLFVTVFIGTVTYAQEIISDALVSIPVDAGGPLACDAEGQLYLGPSSNPRKSVIRVAQDGSILVFRLPESETQFEAFALTASGLAVLASTYDRAVGFSYRMYRFDERGNILTRRAVAIDFHPIDMVMTSSGRIVVVGERSWDETPKPDNHKGAVLDADDQVIQSFDFTIGSDGKPWAPVSMGARSRMAGGDGIAYVIAALGTGPTRSFALATMEESGHVDIHPLSVPPNSEAR